MQQYRLYITLSFNRKEEVAHLSYDQKIKKLKNLYATLFKKEKQSRKRPHEEDDSCEEKYGDEAIWFTECGETDPTQLKENYKIDRIVDISCDEKMSNTCAHVACILDNGFLEYKIYQGEMERIAYHNSLGDIGDCEGNKCEHLVHKKHTYDFENVPYIQQPYRKTIQEIKEYILGLEGKLDEDIERERGNSMIRQILDKHEKHFWKFVVQRGNNSRYVFYERSLFNDKLAFIVDRLWNEFVPEDNSVWIIVEPEPVIVLEPEITEFGNNVSFISNTHKLNLIDQGSIDRVQRIRDSGVYMITFEDLRVIMKGVDFFWFQ